MLIYKSMYGPELLFWRYEINLLLYVCGHLELALFKVFPVFTEDYSTLILGISQVLENSHMSLYETSVLKVRLYFTVIFAFKKFSSKQGKNPLLKGGYGCLSHQ